MRLTTEGHGAYLLLMLDYYATEQAPPDDDDVLAAICKMPIELWQTRYRKVLAPFFTIEGGFWRHERIETEIVDGHSKSASSHARAKAGGDAYARKIALRKASSEPQAGSKPAQTQKQTTSRLVASPQAGLEAGSKKAHLPIPIDSLSTESARDAIEEEGCADDPSAHPDPEEVEALGMGTPIDPKFSLGENQVAVCKFDGASLEIIEAERQGFVNYHLEQGSFSNDWDASWARWWQRWKEYVTKQAEKAERIAKRDRERAPARVEVNNVPDWDSHCGFWKSTGKWPRGIGPDPDSQACKAPLEILIKHKLRKENA
jgi:uncharacterized protein YdaU (DUF1376 family)